MKTYYKILIPRNSGKWYLKTVGVGISPADIQSFNMIKGYAYANGWFVRIKGDKTNAIIRRHVNGKELDNLGVDSARVTWKKIKNATFFDVQKPKLSAHAFLYGSH